MRIASILLTVMVTGFLGAGAAQAKPSLPDKLLAGRVAGKPVQCIDRNRILDTQTFDDGSIFYRMGASADYLQRPGHCSQLNSNRSYATVTSSSWLCSGDTLTVFDASSHIPYGACVFDDFVPYPKPAKTRAQ